MPRPSRTPLSTSFLPQIDAALLRAGDEAGIARLQTRGHGAPDIDRTQGPPGPQALGNANNDAFTTLENASVSGNLFADNGSGADVTPVAIAAVNGSAASVNNQIALASGALLTVNDNGTFTYNPNGRFDGQPAPGAGASNQPGLDSFTYTLVNGDTATVTITINGIDNNDVLTALNNGQTLTGGIGNDIYVIVGSNVTIVEAAGEGFDSVYTGRASYTLNAGAEVEWLTTLSVAGTNSQNLYGNEFGQYLIGNDGNNILRGYGGADIMIGYGGADTYYVEQLGDRVIEVAGGGFDQIIAYVTYALQPGDEVEYIIATSNPGINLYGNEFAQTLTGNVFDNVLDGGGGVDVLVGGGGNDTYYVDDAYDDVREIEAQGFDALYTSTSYTLADNSVRPEIEWFSAADNSATTAINLTGNRYDQYIIGNAGANVINGGGGNDYMYGLGGNDTYYVDSATDAVFESVGNGFDALYTSVTYALAAGQEVEWLAASDGSATTAINLTGNEFANYILGNNGDNLLFGGGGADFLYGQGGNDTYFVDTAGDQVFEAANGGSDEVKSTVSYTLAAGQSVETLSTAASFGTDAINLTGNELANALIGNDGANTLNGGAGSDTLTGRAGADIFQFTTALGAGNVDTIADMLSGTDKIALDDAIFTAIGAPGALAAGAFVTGTAAGDADDRIIYNSATGALFYDADGNGAGAAVQFATLTGNPMLAASDFQVI